MLPIITGIVAYAEHNHGIGYRGQIPWKDKEEMAHFKNITEYNTVIMGRKTAESLPQGYLRNRHNIVISRKFDNFFHIFDSCTTLSRVSSVYEAVREAYMLRSASIVNKIPEIYVIGGKEIYNSMKDLIESWHVSVMKNVDQYQYDAYFDAGLLDDFMEVKVFRKERPTFTKYAFVKKT